MNENYEPWPASKPPDDFAERAARAILARKPAGRRWGKPVGLILAAALLAGGAWATVELTRPAVREAPIEQEGHPAPVARPVPVHVVAPPDSSSDAPLAKPAPRPRTVAPAAEGSAPPTPPKKVIPPPPPPSCDCGPGAIVCTCRSETTRTRQTP